MKKRTKITLRTKIYLTIVALLALTGVFYASNPTPFSFLPFPNGVAGARDFLLVTEYCSENIDLVHCDGSATLFAQTPGNGSCQEKYIAIAPTQSAARGFNPRDVFVTENLQVFKIDVSSGTNNLTLFATLPACSTDHNAITFDHFGTFGFDMIVTCLTGAVFRIDNLPGGPHITPVGNFFPSGGGLSEGATVVPPGFGPHGGELWVADEDNNAIHTMTNAGTVTLNILPHISAERVIDIPSPICTYCDSPAPGSAFFQAEQQLNQLVWRYPLSDFTGLAGMGVILTSEQGADFADTSLVTFNGTNYVQTSFGPRPPGIDEGSSFIDCDVPTPTPTPTPTATFTPTPTPTPTVTPTTCGTSFVIGDLDAVVGNQVTFWSAQWSKKNHLSGGSAPASFKGFANCTNPNPPTCGGTWISDPGNSSGPPPSVPADITVVVSSLITKSGPIISGDIPKMVIVHTDPGYGGSPGHEGTGTVTAVVCP